MLLGGIIAFWRLTRSSELIVARAAGVSAWQFLSAPFACALLLGAIATGVVSPLSSVMLARAETLDNTYLRSTGGPLALSGGQLWLRQSDRQFDPAGVAILHAQSVSLHDDLLTAKDVSIFRLSATDRLLIRVEAASAELTRGQWVLQGARTMTPDHMPEQVGTMTLATDLTVGRVQESFASPDTLSVWSLPDFIALLERSGFSAIRHRLHFQTLLALPLLAGTMALVSAGFSMRPTRRGGVAQMIASGVAAGFVLFVISKVTEGVRTIRRTARHARRLGAGLGRAAAGRLPAAPPRGRLMHRRILLLAALGAAALAGPRDAAAQLAGVASGSKNATPVGP